MPAILRRAAHCAVLTTILCAAATAHASDYFGESAGNHFSYILGSAKESWRGGTVDWYYNPAGAPADLSTDTMLNIYRTSIAKWEAVCNVKFNYKGITSATSWRHETYASIDRINAFGWTTFTDSFASYGGYAWYWYDLPNFMADANLSINTKGNFNASNTSQLEGLITHELGHVLGIGHSDQASAIMFANPYNSLEYQRTLRADDIDACVSLYGKGATPTPTPSLAAHDIIFNWAEKVLPSYFSPAVATQSVTDAAGNKAYLRLYPAANTGLALYLDKIFLLQPSNGQWQDLGASEGWLAQANAK